MRDTQFPCQFFKLAPFGSGDGRCLGDGHYMCRECVEHDEEGWLIHIGEKVLA